MDKSKVIYVSGYRSFELGVFKENDPKIQVVKNVLKKELHQLAEEGLEWVLVSGNLGVELWAVQNSSGIERRISGTISWYFVSFF